MTIKKRGRPLGSKNKKPTPAQLHKIAKKIAHSSNPVSDFQKTLNEWDRMEADADLKDLCQKLQNALSLAYVEIDFLRQKTHLDRQSIIIEYLESRIK
jgi:deoxyadenosine/deoxycytidine kinase